jgi:hypothetical protein
MFNPAPISAAHQREHIRHLFKAGHLSPEAATVQLLRLDIDEIARARKSNIQTESLRIAFPQVVALPGFANASEEDDAS